MKNRKVLNLRTHIGGLHGKTSFDAKKDGAEMELWPIGVFIKSIKGKATNMFIPFPNVVEAALDEEVTDEEKRGPGRPPGPRAV